MIFEIYILISGFFLCLVYFMLIGINKTNKEIFSFSIIMVVLNVIFCGVTYAASHSSGNWPILFYFGGILGASLSLNYIYLIEAFFNKKLPYMGVLKFFTLIFVLFLIADLTLSSLTKDYFYLVEADKTYANQFLRNMLQSLDLSPIAKILGAMAAISSLSSIIYIIVGYKTQLASEKYLRWGIYLSFIVLFNDLLMGGGDVKGLVPLFFLGYIFESLRFSRYLYDQYKLERDQVLSLVQENTSIGLTSDYTRAFAHDLRGVIRKNSKILPSEFKDVIQKLTQLYSPTNDQKITLDNAIQTALLLFQTEIEDKNIKFKKDLSGLEKISNELAVNSNIICSIIYGLLKNAVEAVENEKNKTIRFEIIKSKYFITCAVSNSASALTLDKVTGLPIRTMEEEGRGVGLSLMQSLAKSQFIEFEAKYDSELLRMELAIPI